MLTIAERTGDALIYSKDKEMMDEMDEALANVIEDFLRAVDVEALRLAKRIGKYTLPQYCVSPFLVSLCRARAPAQAARTYQNRLSPGPPLYGRHPHISA
jgi:hypothetical protein